jgi:hypothetical protein
MVFFASRSKADHLVIASRCKQMCIEQELDCSLEHFYFILKQIIAPTVKLSIAVAASREPMGNMFIVHGI